MPERVVLQERIRALFARKMSLDVPSPAVDLFETGFLDSLAFVDLLLHLEQEFGIEVSLAELELDNFRSIAKIAEFVAVRNGMPRRQEGLAGVARSEG